MSESVYRCRGWREACGTRVQWRVRLAYDGARSFPSEYYLCGVCMAAYVQYIANMMWGQQTNVALFQLDPVPEPAFEAEGA